MLVFTPDFRPEDDPDATDVHVVAVHMPERKLAGTHSFRLGATKSPYRWVEVNLVTGERKHPLGSSYEVELTVLAAHISAVAQETAMGMSSRC